MRWMRIEMLTLVLAAPALATNPGDRSPPASGPIRARASEYANSLANVFRVIEERYVRPVNRPKLAEAALEGLYEAAGEPFPPGLRADLARTKDDGELHQLLRVAREKLGDIDSLRDQKALLASMRSLPRALDPFSGLPTGDRRTTSRTVAVGAGIEFESLPEGLSPPNENNDGPVHARKLRGPARLATVTPGSPAQRAGLRPGDILLQINGHVLETESGRELFPHLFAESFGGGLLKLTVTRPGVNTPIEREIIPAQFSIESVFGVHRVAPNNWDYLLDAKHKIGYVRLGFIDEQSVDDMADAIESLQAAGMRGLIFDLRGNPGGFVDPARQIAGMFVKSGIIATVHDRVEGERKYRIENGSGILESNLPTIVLIDEETRGGGEMIAAVLQDHKAARLAGRRSFGKGSVQNTLPINEYNLQFRLTTGSFTRPNGKNMHRFPDSKYSDDWGVRPDPDLEFPMSPEMSKQVREWMNEMVLRPGDSRESITLDDPENDPLREFARLKLIQLLK